MKEQTRGSSHRSASVLRRNLSRFTYRHQMLLKRIALAVLSGALMGWGLTTLADQRAAVPQSEAMWRMRGGIAVGIAISMAISLVRMGWVRSRSRLVTTPVLAVTLIGVATGIMLMADSSPAAAQPPCDATAIGARIEDGNGEVVFADTTLENPGKVTSGGDLQELKITWDFPDVEPTEPWDRWKFDIKYSASETLGVPKSVGGIMDKFVRIMSVDVVGPRTAIQGPELDGKPITSGAANVPDYQGLVLPGLYTVSFSYPGVCEEGFGYVRVVDPPPNILTVIAVIAAVLGAAGTVVALRMGVDRWEADASSDVGLQILDPATMKMVQGSLQPGETYLASVTVRPTGERFPADRPVDVLGAVWGSARQQPTASIDIAAGQTTAAIPFQVPARTDTDTDTPFGLIIDLAVDGNLIQSVRVDQPMTEAVRGVRRVLRGGREVTQATVGLVFKSGRFRAGHLARLERVDALIVLHGSTNDPDRIEIRTFAGDASAKVMSRTELDRNRIGVMAQDYRDALHEVSGRFWQLDQPVDDLSDELLALASISVRMTKELLGRDRVGLPPDSVISISHDSDALRAMTFPWSALYEGPVAAGAELRLCDRYRDHESHCCEPSDPANDAIICPLRFWGFRYRLAQPPGWVEKLPPVRRFNVPDHVERYRARRRQKRLDDRVQSNRILNSRPLELVVAGPENDPNFDPVVHSRELATMGQVHRRPISTIQKMGELFRAGEPIDVLYFLTHHGFERSPVPASGSMLTARGHALDLDGPVDVYTLEQQMQTAHFDRRPLAVLNACNTGAYGLEDSQSLLQTFGRFGVGGFVVTECEITPELAQRAGLFLLTHVFAGEPLDLAMLNARRALLHELANPSMLAYAYHGPAGFCLSSAVDAPLETAEPSIPARQPELALEVEGS